jgi:predicted transcriptional regulator of viral defense system
MSIETDLKKKFKKKAVLSSRELESILGSRANIARALKLEQISKVGSGFYAATHLSPDEALLVTVGRFFPKAVISGLSALAYHNLTDERPNEVSVDIKRDTSLRNQILKVRRVMPKFLIGQKEETVHGLKVKIYDRERSMCDAYRIDKDGPIFLKALKRYVKSKKIDTNTIAKYDAILKTKVLSHLKQELADA